MKALMMLPQDCLVPSPDKFFSGALPEALAPKLLPLGRRQYSGPGPIAPVGAYIYMPQASPGGVSPLQVYFGRFFFVNRGARATSQTLPQENLHEKKATRQETCPHVALTYRAGAGPFTQSRMPVEVRCLGFPLPCLQPIL